MRSLRRRFIEMRDVCGVCLGLALAVLARAAAARPRRRTPFCPATQLAAGLRPVATVFRTARRRRALRVIGAPGTSPRTLLRPRRPRRSSTAGPTRRRARPAVLRPARPIAFGADGPRPIRRRSATDRLAARRAPSTTRWSLATVDARLRRDRRRRLPRAVRRPPVRGAASRTASARARLHHARAMCCSASDQRASCGPGDFLIARSRQRPRRRRRAPGSRSTATCERPACRSTRVGEGGRRVGVRTASGRCMRILSSTIAVESGDYVVPRTSAVADSAGFRRAVADRCSRAMLISATRGLRTR